MNNKFSLIVDFLVGFTADEAKLNQLASEVAKILEKNKPELKFDAETFKSELKEIAGVVGALQNDGSKLADAFDKVKIDFDGDKARKSIEDILEAGAKLDGLNVDELRQSLKDIESIDLDKLEQAFQGLSIDDIEKAAQAMRDALNDFDATKASKELEALAKEFGNSRNGAMQLLDVQSKALKQMEMTGQQGTDEYKKLSAQVSDTEKKVKNMELAFEKAGDAAQNVSMDGSFMDMAAKFESLGTASAALEEFSASAIEVRDAMFELQGKTGATGEELAKLKSIAEDAFISGVGNSVGESIKAIGTAQQMLGKFLNPDEMLAFIKSAQGIATVFGTDINEVLAKSRTFIAQFGLGGQQAGDLVALAMQKTGSGMADTLDTLDEYSQLVVKAGFSAESFVGILSAGMDKGVRDTDKLADSIKETQIRLNDGNAMKAVSGLTSPITESIKKIVELGASGKITVAEMMQQSSEQISKAFDAGQISASVRDQFAAALSGTMAEDIGGQLWTDIFKTEIDTSVIKAQAAKAGADMANALGPVTMFEKVSRNLEIIGVKAVAVFAPIIAGAGGAMQKISQVAPAMNLLKDVNYKGISEAALKVKDFTVSVMQAVPALLAQASAQGVVTTAQKLWNLVASMNPYVAIAAGLAAAILLMKAYAASTWETAKQQEEANNSAIKMVDTQITNTIKQKETAQSGIALVNSFQKQGQAAMNNTDLLLKLEKAYPGVIDMSKSYTENLSMLGAKVLQSNNDISKYKKTLDELSTMKFDLENKKINLEFAVQKEDFENKMTDIMTDMTAGDQLKSIAGVLSMPISIGVDLAKGKAPDFSYYEKIGGKISEFIFGTSTIRKDAEAQIQTYTKEMDKAANADDIKKIGYKLQQAIWRGEGNYGKLTPEQKAALMDDAQKMTDKKIAILENEKKQTINLYNEKKAAGFSENETISQMTEILGKSTDEIKAQLKAQKENEESAKKQLATVTDLAASWKKVKENQSTKQSTGNETLAGYVYEYKEYLKLRKKGADNLTDIEKATYKSLQDIYGKDGENYKKGYDEKMKSQKQYVKEGKQNAKLEKKIRLESGEEEAGKSAYEIAKQKADIMQKYLDFSEKEFAIIQKGKILNEKRQSNSYDEYDLAIKSLEIQKAKNKAFEKELLAKSLIREKTNTVDGKTTTELVISTTAKFKKDSTEKEDIETFLRESKLNIQQKGLDIINIQTKIGEKQLEWDDKKKELEAEKILMEVKINPTNVGFEKAISILDDQFNKLRTNIELNETKIKDIENKKNEDIKALGKNADKLAFDRIRDAANKDIFLINEKNDKLIDAEKRKKDVIATTINEYYKYRLDTISVATAKELDVLTKRYDEEEARIQKLNDSFNEIANTQFDNKRDETLKQIDSEKEAKLKALEESGKMELSITEDIEGRKAGIEKHYDNLRIEAEKKFAQQKENFANFQKGVEVEQTRSKNLELNLIEKAGLIKKLEILEEEKQKKGSSWSIADQKQIDDLNTQLGTVNKVIDKNASTWNTSINLMGEGLQDALGNYFAGGKDAAVKSLKEYFSAIFGVLVQALKTEINAAVLNLVLDWLWETPLPPFAAVAGAAIIYETINAGINAIAQPVLEGLLSLASGGRIDQPTLAVVGDGAKLGSSNKEWIFRDEQLRATVQMASLGSNKVLEQRLMNIENALSNLNIETKISGNDIYLSLSRTKNKIAMRSF